MKKTAFGNYFPKFEIFSTIVNRISATHKPFRKPNRKLNGENCNPFVDLANTETTNIGAKGRSSIGEYGSFI
jgi:hypothetical protein